MKLSVFIQPVQRHFPDIGAHVADAQLRHFRFDTLPLCGCDADQDPRIAKAFEMKELLGFSIREIAAELQISEPRVYQLVARAKVIGREYRQNNG